MTSDVRICAGQLLPSFIAAMGQMTEFVLPLERPPRLGGAGMVVTVAPEISADGHRYLPAYSSTGEFEQSRHAQLVPLVISGGDVCCGWPSKELWLVIDPGRPGQQCLSGAAIRRSTSLADELAGRRSLQIRCADESCRATTDPSA